MNFFPRSFKFAISFFLFLSFYLSFFHSVTHTFLIIYSSSSRKRNPIYYGHRRFPHFLSRLFQVIPSLRCVISVVLSQYAVYKIMCVFTCTYSQNTKICPIVSLCNKQHYEIYNYMFRPCKRAIIRLFTKPSSRLHNRSLGGTRSHSFIQYSV